jgi:hypothetical protein
VSLDVNLFCLLVILGALMLFELLRSLEGLLAWEALVKDLA